MSIASVVIEVVLPDAITSFIPDFTTPGTFIQLHPADALMNKRTAYHRKLINLDPDLFHSYHVWSTTLQLKAAISPMKI